MLIALLIVGALAAGLVVVLRVARKKNVDIILRAAAKRTREPATGLRHVFFCFVDHYEPLWMQANDATGRERVRAWLDHYPRVVDPFRDDAGRAPQHSFFFPEEEYRPEYLDMLADLCVRGYGDVEVHLHHDGDTSEGVRQKLVSFKETLHNQHGLLRRHPDTNEIEYAFIHGNWALDNSRPDGRWCGVNDEITILRETGCYADFTFPSAPHPTQPPTINQIYYCDDDPARPCSHFTGREAVHGQPGHGDMLMIPGPLAINWARRRHGIIPAVENGDVCDHNPPTPERVDLWLETAIALRGLPNWIFVKVHTHGTQEGNAKVLLGSHVEPMYQHLLSRYNDGRDYKMHFVTAREMFECVKAAESGDSARMRRFEEFEYVS